MKIEKTCHECYGLGTEMGTFGEEICHECDGHGTVEIPVAPLEVQKMLLGWCECTVIH